MGFNSNHSAKARLLRLNCDFCVRIVALFIILYFSAVQNPTLKGLERSPPFFLSHVSRTVSDKEVTICLSHLPRSTTMQSVTHFVSVPRKGERKKKRKQTKQPFCFLVKHPCDSSARNRVGGVDMTLLFSFFYLIASAS